MSDHKMDLRPPARSPEETGAASDSGSGPAGAEPVAPHVTLEIDEANDDLEKAMREALAAVESVHGERAAQPAPPNAGGAGAAATEGPGETEVAVLRREIADLRDRSVRTLADFDNYRKRADRERQETRRYALLEPLREFLPIADNLGRALSAGGSSDDLKRGIEMIHRQMEEMLRRFGVREVPAAGEVFNPAVHEAVARVESAAVATPTVAETLVPGYMLHDRLLRPAMVKVAVPVEKTAGGPEDSPRE
jgi:molecular chaperone GrpE